MKDKEVDVAVAAAAAGETNCGEGRTVLEVECGLNKAVLHLDRLCQGSKGACILFEETWMTPNEFQAASGRETAKDWKRSIKHHDKSLKLLIIKGFLFVDPAVCRCEHCVPSSSSGPPAPPASPPSVPPSSESALKESRKKLSKKEVASQAKKQKLNNVASDKSTKESKPIRASKKPTSPVRQLRKRKLPVGRREKRLAARRTAKKTTAAKPKRGTKSRGINCAKKGAKRKASTTTKDVNGDHCEDDTDDGEFDQENAESDEDTKLSRPKENGAAKASCDEIESDANSSTQTDSPTPDKKNASSNSDSDTLNDDEEAVTRTVKDNDTEPDGHINDESQENTNAINNNDEQSDGSSARRNKEKESKKRRKVPRKKISNGRTFDDEGGKSHQKKNSGEDSKKPKSRKRATTSGSSATTAASDVAPDGVPGTIDDDVAPDSKSTDSAINDDVLDYKTACSTAADAGPGGLVDFGVATNCKTEGTSVDEGVASDCETDNAKITDVVTRCKSEEATFMNTDVVTDYKTGDAPADDVVTDSKVGDPMDTDVVTDCKTIVTDFKVGDLDVVADCKADCHMASDVAANSRIGVPVDIDIVTDSKTESSAADDVVSDCETSASGELIIAEPTQDEEHDATDAATIKADICANSVSVDAGTSRNDVSSDMPTPTTECRSNGTGGDALSGAENDQSATTTKSESQKIDTAKKLPTENVDPADDVTQEQNGSGTTPAVRGEAISPKREARLLNIIQELKTYKKHLSEKIDEKKRHTDHTLSSSDNSSRLLQTGGGNMQRLSPCVSDTNSEPPSSGLKPPYSGLLPAPASAAVDLVNAVPRRQKSRRKESAIIRQLTGPTVGQARTQAWVNENGATVYYTSQPNGVASIPFSTYTQEPRLDGTNQTAHSDSRFTNNNVDSSDKCLLKIPKRYSANASFPVSNGCAAPSMQDTSSRKRKMVTPKTNSAAKRQRCSWPINKPDSAACLLDLTKCISSDAAAKSVMGLSTVGVSSSGGVHQAGKALSEVQAAAMTRPVRRSHISSWTADDVYSFVLSSPHAAIYAKEFLELRITGRVLQNLTAIQMMRILRIGEHAARAVRTAVEKILMASPATNHSTRR